MNSAGHLKEPVKTSTTKKVYCSYILCNAHSRSGVLKLLYLEPNWETNSDHTSALLTMRKTMSQSLGESQENYFTPSTKILFYLWFIEHRIQRQLGHSKAVRLSGEQNKHQRAQ